MKRQSLWKRVTAIILTAILAFSLVPVVGVREKVLAKEFEKKSV